MSFYDPFSHKVQHWQNNSNGPLKVNGLTPSQWMFFLDTLLNENNSFFLSHTQIVICPSLEIAEDLFSIVKKRFKKDELLFFPGLEHNPYSGFISSEKSLFDRFKVLDSLASGNTPKIILCTFESFLLKIPKPQFFLENNFLIEKEEIFGPHDLAKKLVEFGYTSSITVEEPGTFSRKGEIFDLFPMVGPPIRIHYFDEIIEDIFAIDINTQKTKRSESFGEVRISPTPYILANPPFRNTLRENIPMPSPRQKYKYEFRKDLFSHLNNDELFENYPVYLSLFFQETCNLQDYLGEKEVLISLIEGIEVSQNFFEFKDDLRVQYDEVINDLENSCVLPNPEHFYNLDYFEVIENKKLLDFNHVDISSDPDNFKNEITIKLEGIKNFFNRKINPTKNRFDYIKDCLVYLKDHFKDHGHIIFTYQNESSKAEIEYLIDTFELSSQLGSRIKFVNFPLEEGFFFPGENALVLSDGDLFSRKKEKTKKISKNKIDLFAEQLSTLKKGDYVIHSQYGMGIFQGMESMDVGEIRNDFLILEYASKDKVYVPVYKLNQIQKHADSTANLKPNNLRTNKFSIAKEKAKNSAKTLAFDLLKLQAERNSAFAFAFSEPDHEFKEFELAFPFSETPDQTSAIEDVLKSMQKPLPMDHLICGDVGFGKTEVAMRAAFKAILDGKQVAVLVPTTILALQHYNSFSSRFKDFPVTVNFLSRFKTPKEQKIIKAELEEGTLDIVIGTHKLISSTIKFSDLGLVIVDEEQRFGVNHKEKLKLLKSSVDFLTLTATPIPRTLQLAFLGLKDLSLIQTAPPKRQSIKTYIIKEDPHTIQTAIEKELNRGGQVFIVHNRVQDIEILQSKIQELVPKASIIYAHGQMAEKELEKRVKGFYEGKYQILISTTIIESGIDIPNANTMIIYNAQNFGLSQLHQLRGRIGRSDKKAYAYFVIPKERKLKDVANKRLKAIQTYADKGSGFNIASSDMEIRGAGDILGANQSGHIDSIGLELYMELLKEAIDELKGEKKIINSDIEVATPFPCFIPNNYIEDPSERLKEYKRLSNCQSLDLLTDIKDTFGDIYGKHPQELRNLFMVFETRICLQFCGLKAVKVAGKVITLEFDKNILDRNVELKNSVIDTFIGKPNKYKFTPDYKVFITNKKTIGPEELLEFAENISNEIKPPEVIN